jgi:cytochrome c oxidase subunit 2
MAQEGEQVAVRHACVACHSVDGQTHIGPTWARLYGSKVRLSDGREIVADEAYLTKSMMEPLADLVAGYKPLMPTYQGILTAPEAAALVEYIKSLTYESMQPSVALPSVVVRYADGGVSPEGTGREGR